MNYKLYLKVVSVTFLLGFVNFSWAVDVQNGSSSFLSDSLTKMIQLFANDKTYDELKLRLWNEYLSYSERYAEKFAEVAKENQTSLKSYMCASGNPSESAKKIQSFQRTTVNDFNLKNDRDQIEIAKLQQLQATYKEICEASGDGLALNNKASMVIAETTFYSIYISTRDQLIAFLNLKN